MTETNPETPEEYVDQGPVPPPPPAPAPPPVVSSRVATPTPPVYLTGSVKQDPVTLAVALRTNIYDPENRKDWGVMSIDRGGSYASYDAVGQWPDLFIPVPEVMGASNDVAS